MTMTSAWTFNIDEENVGRLTFDLPGEKVNKFTAQAMTELEQILDEQLGREAIKALVIRSGKGDGFIVGADINELAGLEDETDARAKAKAGKAVFARLAALRVPTVAVIHGACLGGGLEMALACRYRLVTDHAKTSIGLPEVNLGIIPGWGGCLRLPRLIGLAHGLKMIVGGRPVDGRRALGMGLADAIAAPSFLDDEINRFVERILSRTGARAALRRRRRARPLWTRILEGNPLGRLLIYRRARKEIERRTKGHYPAPAEALKVIRKTYRRRLRGAGPPTETAAFARLACTTTSRNLVRLFQAGQRLKKSGAAGTEPIHHGAVIGAGIMGAGIAGAVSRSGIAVRLRDVSWEQLAKGMGAVAKDYRAMVKRRKMTEGQLNLAMHRIGPTVDDTGLAGAEIVIEAVAEDLAIKQQVLKDIESVVSPDTVICTNTSSLSLGDLASVLDRPQRFVGLHFFNPVSRMPLVEVVPFSGSSDEAVVVAAELVRQMGKTPMIVGDCAGFLVNRILLPYLIESTWMFEEGADAQRIDGLLESFGMPMGPLALVDEVGLDVGYKVAKVLEDAYGARMHVPQGLGAVAGTADYLGRKSGAGFYRYRNGRRKPNRRVERLARHARKSDGVEPRELSDDQIIDRAILIMVNEAARCLEEGVVESPESVDMAMVLGTGFAPFRGGLLRYADERGVVEIKKRLDELAAQFGERFESAALIEKLAGNGGRFYRDE